MLKAPIEHERMLYPIYNFELPFQEYIEKTRLIVEERRLDLQQPNPLSEAIIEANTPYEFYPKNPRKKGQKIQYGALLIHGLFDSPSSLKDIGIQLQANGILARSILLPGHGTKPSDLLDIQYQDWLQAVKYGVEGLKHEVENLFLIGYSTGATLSIHEAMQNPMVKGLVLLSPAIRIKPPFDAILFWQQVRKLFNKKNSSWVTIEDENDYAKYRSISFNAVFQLTQLTDLINTFYQVSGLKQNFLMVVSREDETISSHHAIEFFNYVKNEQNRLLLYSASKQNSSDPRVTIRHTNGHASIKHFSHMAIPFAPNNPHYGKKGDFIYASLPENEGCSYGAYNLVEQRIWDWLCRLGLSKYRRRALTYNPDFEFMSREIINFLFSHE